MDQESKVTSTTSNTGSVRKRWKPKINADEHLPPAFRKKAGETGESSITSETKPKLRSKATAPSNGKFSKGSVASKSPPTGTNTSPMRTSRSRSPVNSSVPSVGPNTFNDNDNSQRSYSRFRQQVEQSLDNVPSAFRSQSVRTSRSRSPVNSALPSAGSNTFNDNDNSQRSYSRFRQQVEQSLDNVPSAFRSQSVRTSRSRSPVKSALTSTGSTTFNDNDNSQRSYSRFRQQVERSLDNVPSAFRNSRRSLNTENETPWDETPPSIKSNGKGSKWPVPGTSITFASKSDTGNPSSLTGAESEASVENLSSVTTRRPNASASRSPTRMARDLVAVRKDNTTVPEPTELPQPTPIANSSTSSKSTSKSSTTNVQKFVKPSAQAGSSVSQSTSAPTLKVSKSIKSRWPPQSQTSSQPQTLTRNSSGKDLPNLSVNVKGIAKSRFAKPTAPSSKTERRKAEARTVSTVGVVNRKDDASSDSPANSTASLRPSYKIHYSGKDSLKKYVTEEENDDKDVSTPILPISQSSEVDLVSEKGVVRGKPTTSTRSRRSVLIPVVWQTRVASEDSSNTATPLKRKWQLKRIWEDSQQQVVDDSEDIIVVSENRLKDTLNSLLRGSDGGNGDTHSMGTELESTSDYSKGQHQESNRWNVQKVWDRQGDVIDTCVEETLEDETMFELFSEDTYVPVENTEEENEAEEYATGDPLKRTLSEDFRFGANGASHATDEVVPKTGDNMPSSPISNTVKEPVDDKPKTGFIEPDFGVSAASVGWDNMHGSSSTNLDEASQDVSDTGEENDMHILEKELKQIESALGIAMQSNQGTEKDHSQINALRDQMEVVLEKMMTGAEPVRHVNDTKPDKAATGTAISTGDPSTLNNTGSVVQRGEINSVIPGTSEESEEFHSAENSNTSPRAQSTKEISTPVPEHNGVEETPNEAAGGFTKSGIDITEQRDVNLLLRKLRKTETLMDDTYNTEKDVRRRDKVLFQLEMKRQQYVEELQDLGVFGDETDDDDDDDEELRSADEDHDDPVVSNDTNDKDGTILEVDDDNGRDADLVIRKLRKTEKLMEETYAQEKDTRRRDKMLTQLEMKRQQYIDELWDLGVVGDATLVLSNKSNEPGTTSAVEEPSDATLNEQPGKGLPKVGSLEDVDDHRDADLILRKLRKIERLMDDTDSNKDIDARRREKVLTQLNAKRQQYVEELRDLGVFDESAEDFSNEKNKESPGTNEIGDVAEATGPRMFHGNASSSSFETETESRRGPELVTRKLRKLESLIEEANINEKDPSRREKVIAQLKLKRQQYLDELNGIGIVTESSNGTRRRPDDLESLDGSIDVPTLEVENTSTTPTEVEVTREEADNDMQRDSDLVIRKLKKIEKLMDEMYAKEKDSERRNKKLDQLHAKRQQYLDELRDLGVPEISIGRPPAYTEVPRNMDNSSRRSRTARVSEANQVPPGTDSVASQQSGLSSIDLASLGGDSADGSDFGGSIISDSGTDLLPRDETGARDKALTRRKLQKTQRVMEEVAANEPNSKRRTKKLAQLEATKQRYSVQLGQVDSLQDPENADHEGDVDEECTVNGSESVDCDSDTKFRASDDTTVRTNGVSQPTRDASEIKNLMDNTESEDAEHVDGANLSQHATLPFQQLGEDEASMSNETTAMHDAGSSIVDDNSLPVEEGYGRNEGQQVALDAFQATTSKGHPIESTNSSNDDEEDNDVVATEDNESRPSDSNKNTGSDTLRGHGTLDSGGSNGPHTHNSVDVASRDDLIDSVETEMPECDDNVLARNGSEMITESNDCDRVSHEQPIERIVGDDNVLARIGSELTTESNGDHVSHVQPHERVVPGNEVLTDGLKQHSTQSTVLNDVDVIPVASDQENVVKELPTISLNPDNGNTVQQPSDSMSNDATEIEALQNKLRKVEKHIWQMESSLGASVSEDKDYQRLLERRLNFWKELKARGVPESSLNAITTRAKLSPTRNLTSGRDQGETKTPTRMKKSKATPPPVGLPLDQDQGETKTPTRMKKFKATPPPDGLPLDQDQAETKTPTRMKKSKATPPPDGLPLDQDQGETKTPTRMKKFKATPPPDGLPLDQDQAETKTPTRMKKSKATPPPDGLPLDQDQGETKTPTRKKKSKGSKQKRKFHLSLSGPTDLAEPDLSDIEEEILSPIRPVNPRRPQVYADMSNPISNPETEMRAKKYDVFGQWSLVFDRKKQPR